MKKISVITPTYNSEKTILKNINSLVNQSYDNFEQIIIDNNSTDQTIKLSKKFYLEKKLSEKVRIISEKDKGISDAFNKGLLFSNGDIIAILNSDDYYLDQNIFVKVQDILKSPQYLFVHGDMYFEDPILGSLIKHPKGKKMNNGMIYNHPTLFFKKEVYDLIGTFNINYYYSMDFEFLCRCENKIPNFHSKGYYLKEKPITYMLFGGKTWNSMMPAEETKKALIEQNMWSFSAKYYYFQKILFTRLNQVMIKLKLNKYWSEMRKLKWKLTHP